MQNTDDKQNFKIFNKKGSVAMSCLAESSWSLKQKETSVILILSLLKFLIFCSTGIFKNMFGF